MAGSANDDGAIAEARASVIAAIVGSRPTRTRRRSPGTGKTHTLKEALRDVDGNGLALTFIRNLSRISRRCSATSGCFTFHGFRARDRRPCR
jgi:hypothetical protein